MDKSESTLLSVAFGQTVAGLRDHQKLSQAKLAEKIGIHKTYLSDIEQGKRHPSIMVQFDIAEAFGIKAYKFVKLVEEQLSANKELLEDKQGVAP